MYKLNDRVLISSQNENYELFKDKVLIVTHIAIDESEHPGYDSSMGGEQLMDFVTEDGEEVPFSLYEYEITHE